MPASLYLISTILIAVCMWFVLSSAWGDDVAPMLRLPIAIVVALLWPLALVGLLLICVLIFANKPKKP